MNRNDSDLISRNSMFAWIALGTGLILLIPLVAMQFTDAVRWDRTDFSAMGALLMGTGSLFVLVARKLSRRRRVVAGVLFLAAFTYLWAELAVGIFTNWGS